MMMMINYCFASPVFTTLRCLLPLQNRVNGYRHRVRDRLALNLSGGSTLEWGEA